MPRKLKALQRVYYAGREYTPGEAFDAQADTDAEAMVLVGTAEYAKDEPPPPPKRTRMTVEQVAAANEPNMEEPRRYNRRDMRAEDND